MEHILDPIEYAKKANAYIYFYLYVKRVRQFYATGFEPYSVQAVWSAAPDNFDGDYTKIPSDLERAFEMHLGLV